MRVAILLAIALVAGGVYLYGGLTITASTSPSSIALNTSPP